MEVRIREVFETCLKLEKEGRKVYHLELGVPGHKPPAVGPVLEGSELYPPHRGIPELRERLAEWANEAFGTDFKAEHILVTNGAMQALALLFLHLRGKKILLPAPGFGPYYDLAEICGVHYETYNPLAKDLVGEIASKLPAEALLINYPHNPTGYAPENGELERVWAEFSDRLLIINDAVYHAIYFNHKKPIQVGHVFIDSFSKTFALPGLRLGYLAWRRAEDLQKHLRLLTAGVSVMAQKVGLEILENLEKKYLYYVREFYKERLSVVLRILGDMLEVIPRGAFYAWVRTSGDGEEVARKLLYSNPVVGVVPGSAFRGRREMIRISFSRYPPSELEEALKAVREKI